MGTQGFNEKAAVKEWCQAFQAESQFILHFSKKTFPSESRLEYT